MATHLIFGIPATLGLLALSLLAMRQGRQQTDTLAQLQDEVHRRESAEEALRQSQKMEAVGRLTGGIAHDFNNHLTVISSNIELLQRRMPAGSEALNRLTDAAMAGVQRAATLTHRLLAFSRQQPLDPEPLDAGRLVASMSDLLRRTLGEDIAIETVLAGGLWQTRVDTNQLENVLLNLAVNARDAMPDGGKLTIETANAHLDDAYAAQHAEVVTGQYVMLAVSDTGVGMTPEVIGKVFEPFFTTKPLGQGTGLGLSMVYGFVKQSGGHVAIYSEPGQGCTVKVYLPRFVRPEPQPDGATRTPDTTHTRGKGETILVVEDDEEVRRSSVEALREMGYEVLEAGDAMDGVRLIVDHGGIDLLFTDVGLPGGVNGRALADAARSAQPGVRVLFTTGYTRNAILHKGVLDHGVHFIAKPFSLTALAAKIREVLEAPATVATTQAAPSHE
jgi:signal transduction histidine kinase/ActR/RegA family two-component response regulator